MFLGLIDIMLIIKYFTQVQKPISNYLLPRLSRTLNSKSMQNYRTCSTYIAVGGTEINTFKPYFLI
jgi:cadmium resistance protein CadD (predicted permease)